MTAKKKTPDYDYSDFEKKEDPVPAGANVLARIGGVARDQLHAEARVAQLTADLKEAKETVRHLSENIMPELLDEAGQSEDIVVEGMRIKIATAIRGSIPAGNEAKAFGWLEEHGHGNLIKRQFTIDFGKDDDKWADKFERDMAQRKKALNSKRKKTVHPQTLVSFIKGQLEEGTNIPMDTFGVHRQRFTKVTVK